MKYQSNNKDKTTQDIVASNIQFLMEQLEAGHSEVLTQYLNAMARFHDYSFGNILLIARQCPSATHVAGIRTWNSLGRIVKKGEKGILILAPIVRRQRRQEENVAGTESDKKLNNEEGKSVAGFRGVYVWDVAQTDGNELPKCEEVHGDTYGHLALLVNFVATQNITFGYSEDIAPARGVSMGGKIVLLPNMSEAEQFATLVHEVAHELIHKADRRASTSKTVRETEAEAVAFVVSKAIGLEIGTASADYIQLYKGDAHLLKESLEVIQQTSAVILGAISPEVTAEPTQFSGALTPIVEKKTEGCDGTDNPQRAYRLSNHKDIVSA